MKTMLSVLAALVLCGLIVTPGEVTAQSIFYETVDFASLGRSSSIGLPSLTISGTTTSGAYGPPSGRVDTNIINIDVVADPHQAAIVNHCLTSANEVLKGGTGSEVKLAVVGAGGTCHPTHIPLCVIDLSQGNLLSCSLLPKKEPK